MTSWGPGVLLPLSPVGLGTPWVEGLSSYVARLAVAHLVPTRLLVAELFPRSIGCLARDAMLGRRGVWLNGMGATAHDVACALEGFTLQRGLERLTLRALHEHLPPGRVLALRRRWCPLCYSRMRRECGECWDPLLWFLAPARWCVRHRRWLVETCSSCGRGQPWLPRDTALGWCAWCGHDLASSRAGAGPMCVPSRRVARDVQWDSAVCADILGALSCGASPVSAAQLTRALVALAERHDGGNCFAFARRVGVPLDTPRHWMRSGRPRFDHLLLLGRRLGLHPASLLFEQFTTGSELVRSRNRFDIGELAHRVARGSLLPDSDIVAVRGRDARDGGLPNSSSLESGAPLSPHLPRACRQG